MTKVNWTINIKCHNEISVNILMPTNATKESLNHSFELIHLV